MKAADNENSLYCRRLCNIDRKLPFFCLTPHVVVVCYIAAVVAVDIVVAVLAIIVVAVVCDVV